jgi:hypothetical protein
MILTHKDLRPKSKNKQIEKLTIKDFYLVNILDLGHIHNILYIDLITKQAHTIR